MENQNEPLLIRPSRTTKSFSFSIFHSFIQTCKYWTKHLYMSCFLSFSLLLVPVELAKTEGFSQKAQWPYQGLSPFTDYLFIISCEII